MRQKIHSTDYANSFQVTIHNSVIDFAHNKHSQFRLHCEAHKINTWKQNLHFIVFAFHSFIEHPLS